MNTTCYIYSVDDDRSFVQHIEAVKRNFKNTLISYSIGSERNCNLEEIFSLDPLCSRAVLVRSYSHVPNRKQILDTFLWVCAKYDVVKYGGNFIATDRRLDQERTSHLLRALIPPSFDVNISLAKPNQEIKNQVKSFSRASVYLH